eukprot:TRINITY_DN7816_c0_g1_i2.p1 TRINITY_DN7816_c0_g1~~TRINITY_DN7816_c0_g1_i2.p1  ORF type:complete len:471 (-),score=139.23 TRINITY_DN7816_c0_g1_i2:321-1733(-)
MSGMLFVKVVATLTVAAANIVVCVCVVLLYQLVQCRVPGAVGRHCQGDNTKYILALVCTSILCLLVLITATLDNVSWWSSSFPDAFLSTESVAEVFHRLAVADPGFKVTIQQDFFSLAGGEIVPKSRQKSIEMFKPKQWKDQTNLQFRSNLAGTVIKVRIEVGPADREAREDMNKFVKEMVEENSTPGSYDRRLLTGVSMEARLPQMPLFQGKKIPKYSVENRTEAISLPLSSSFHKIFGEPVRIFVFSNNYFCRNLFPALFSFKQIIYMLVMIIPVLGTCLSLVLADNTLQIIFKKKFTRRKNLDEMLQEHPLCVQPIRLTRRIPQVFRKLTGKAPANVTSSSQDLLSFETFGGLSPVCESTSTITEETDRGSDVPLLSAAASNEADDDVEETPLIAESSLSSSTVSIISPLLPATSSTSSDNPPSYSALVDISISPYDRVDSPPCYREAVQAIDIQKMIRLGRETDLV